MVKVAIILLVILKGVQNNCGAGCLSCKTDQQCQICDTLNNYVLVGQSCVRQQIEHCLISFEYGFCKICDYGYYLAGDFSCAPIPTHSTASILNCNDYDSIDRCMVCNFHSYLKNGICRTISKKIENCLIYKNDGQCDYCDLSLPNEKQTICQKVTDTKKEHCLFFRNPVICTKCKQGYNKDHNYILKHLQELYEEKYIHMRFWREKHFSLIYNIPVCSASLLINNCKIMENETQCTQCANNYTLSKDKLTCFIKPQPPSDPRNRIPHCYIFTDKTYEKCQACYEGYKMNESSSQCILKPEAEKIDNCQIQSQQYPNQCIICDNLYYLKIVNSKQVCQKRLNIVNNCFEYSRVEDKCASCYKGYEFHNDNLFCSLSIVNCLELDTTSSVLLCKACNEGYYLNDYYTQCLKVLTVIEGCKYYQPGGMSCKECAQGYYLFGNKCSQQTSIYKCDALSILVSGLCEKCENDGTNVQTMSMCTTLPTRYQTPNCLYYDSNYVCIQCTGNYVVYKESLDDSFTKCKLVDGCQSLVALNQDQNCASCLTGYYQYSQKCLKADYKHCIYNFVSWNVTATNYNFVATQPCQLCEENYAFFVSQTEVTHTKQCVQQSQVLFGENCYKLYSESVVIEEIICDKCRRGYYVPSDATNKKNCLPSYAFASYKTLDDRYQNVYDQNFQKIYDQLHFNTLTYQSDTPVVNAANCLVADPVNAYCLKCKAISTTVYKAQTLEAILADLKELQTHIYESPINIYQDEMSFPSTFPVIHQCQRSVDFKPHFPKDAVVYQLKDTNYYLCRYSNNFSYYSKDDTNMSISLNIANSSSPLPIDYVYNDPATYTATCNFRIATQTFYQTYYSSLNLQGFPNKPSNIGNCVEGVDNRSRILHFEQQMFLSCYQCADNYSLIYSFYDASIVQADNQSNNRYFKWVINECIDTINIPIFQQVQNCFVYQKVRNHNRIEYYCQQCNAGYAPVKKYIPLICDYKTSNSKYDPTTSSNCSSNYQCYDQNECTQTCSPACQSYQKCINGSCTDIACHECPDSNNQACLNSLEGCQNDKYCVSSNYTCADKSSLCDNQHEIYDTVSNQCQPILCGQYSQKTILEQEEIFFTYVNSLESQNITFNANNPSDYYAMTGCQIGQTCQVGACVNINTQKTICEQTDYLKQDTKTSQCFDSIICSSCTDSQKCLYDDSNNGVQCIDENDAQVANCSLCSSTQLCYIKSVQYTCNQDYDNCKEFSGLLQWCSYNGSYSGITAPDVNLPQSGSCAQNLFYFSNQCIDVCYWHPALNFPIYCLTGQECLQDEEGIKFCGEIQIKSTSQQIQDQKNMVQIGQEYQIMECRAINNCDTSDKTKTELNKCRKCKQGHAFYQPAEGQNDQTSECIPLRQPNGPTEGFCLYAKKVSENAVDVACFQCLPGYNYISDQDICDTIVPNCKLVNDEGVCLFCLTDYPSSIYDSSKLMYIDIIESIGNCQLYQSKKNELIHHGGIYDENCILFEFFLKKQETEPNILKTSENFCYKCKEGYLLNYESKCLQIENSDNCGQYDTGSTENIIKCKTCKMGYKLAEGSKRVCEKITPPENLIVPMCTAYDTDNNCIQCSTESSSDITLNYYPSFVNAKDSAHLKQFCFKWPSFDPNCLNFDFDQFKSTGKLSCLKCNYIKNENSFPLKYSQYANVCNDIPMRTNCIKLDAQTNKDTFECVQCSDAYYLNTLSKLCVQRTKLYDNCEKYYISSDDCEKYETIGTSQEQQQGDQSSSDQSQIATTENVDELLGNPPITNEDTTTIDLGNWIVGCRLYADEKTCDKCYPHKYLNEAGTDYFDKCINSSSIINNCYVYSSDSFCEECMPFYTLINNQCIQIKASNCKSFDDKGLCNSCPDSHPKLDEQMNCIIDAFNPWCLKYINTGPADSSYECEICQKDFYPNKNGICTYVQNKVDNCQYYQANRICTICEEGYYLQYDGKKCIINPVYDDNCQTFEYGTECSLCEWGYYLNDDNICVECKIGVQDGCAFCNPSDPSVCILCLFGYSVDSTQKCILNESIIQNKMTLYSFSQNQQTTESSKSSIVRNYAFLKKVFIIVSFVILLL